MTFALHGGQPTWNDNILGACSLMDGLPPWLTVTRAAGPASWQTRPAENDKTFVAYDLNLAANTPRFSYNEALGRNCLLVENVTTNQLTNTIITDNGTPNLPDGWITTAGAPGTDFLVQSGGPDGGKYLYIPDTSVNSRGVYQNTSFTPSTNSGISAWVLDTGSGASRQLRFGPYNGELRCTLPVAPPSTWFTLSGAYSIVGVSPPQPCYGLMSTWSDPAGTFKVACPQFEMQDCPTSWVPTQGTTGTRARENTSIADAVVPYHYGTVQFTWIPNFPLYSYLQAYVYPFGFNFYEGLQFRSFPTATFVLYYDSAVRITIPAPNFTAGQPLRIKIEYGSWGSRLTINGVSAASDTPWTASAPGGFATLGGRSGLNTFTQSFADLIMVGA